MDSKKPTLEKDWITKAGLRAVCLAIRHRCGYVGVPVGHPLYGVPYSQETKALGPFVKGVEEGTLGKRSPIFILTAYNGIKASPEHIFDVHGGLTYSSPTSEQFASYQENWKKNNPDKPYPTDSYPAPGPEWWFGFDCGHYDDAPIESDPLGFSHGGVIRSLEYVVEECESLAEQIVRVK